MANNFRRRLMMMHSQKVEEPLTIIDYIEANGISFIELDYIPNINTEITIFYEGTIETNPILDASRNSTTSRVYLECEDGYINYAVGNMSEISQIKRTSGKDTLILHLPADANVSLGLKTGVILTSYANSALVTANLSYSSQLKNCVNINLFKNLSTNKIATGIKLYGIEISENNQIIMALSPFDKGKINGLIDNINGKLYTSPNNVKFKSSKNP